MLQQGSSLDPKDPRASPTALKATEKDGACHAVRTAKQDHNSPPVIVVHDDSGDQRLSEARRQRHEGVIEQSLRHDLQLVLPHGIIDRIDPRPSGLRVYGHTRQNSRLWLSPSRLLPATVRIGILARLPRGPTDPTTPTPTPTRSRSTLVGEALSTVSMFVARACTNADAIAWSLLVVARVRQRCPLRDAATSVPLLLLLLFVWSTAAVISTAVAVADARYDTTAGDRRPPRSAVVAGVEPRLVVSVASGARPEGSRPAAERAAGGDSKHLPGGSSSSCSSCSL